MSARTLVLAGIAVVACAAAGRGQVGVPSLPADGYPRQPDVDVLHYDLRVAVDPDRAAVVGRTALLFEAVGLEVTRIRLDLAAAMTVDSARVGGARVGVERAGDSLVVTGLAVPPGTRAEVDVWYRGSPTDGLVFSGGSTGARVFADNWADRAHQGFPSIDHPADKATASIEVVAPATLEIVANGRLVERVELGDGRARTRWVESAQIPVYGMVLGAADFAVTSAGEVHGVPVSHWAFVGDSAAAEAAFGRSVEIFGFYDSLLGPYPYEKLAHVQSSTKFGGMENPSAIFYDDETIATSLAEGAAVEGAARDQRTKLVAHETVHQWFGDAVTEKDWNHLWLSEGFADYFAAVFFEFHGGSTGRGPVELARRMRGYAEAVLEADSAGPGAIYAPGVGPGGYEALLNAYNYQKGAWVLHMLRRLVGDDAFFSGVRNYYATLRDGNAWTADFRRVMEDAAGRDLGWFFDQWVERAGHPVLAVDTGPAPGGGTRVHLRQVQPGRPYRLAVDLALSGPEGESRETVELDGASASIDVPGTVDEMLLDPDGWLLFESAPTD